MSAEKRPRGRPRGSGKDDSPVLAQVADFLVRDASLKATAAMRRILPSRKDWGATDETLIRRWQGKWKKARASLLAAASERARPKPVVCASNYYPSSTIGAYEWLIAEQRRMQDLIDPPHMRALRMQQFSRIEELRQIQALVDPLCMQTARDLLDPPYMREYRRFEELQQRLAAFNRW